MFKIVIFFSCISCCTAIILTKPTISLVNRVVHRNDTKLSKSLCHTPGTQSRFFTYLEKSVDLVAFCYALCAVIYVVHKRMPEQDKVFHSTCNPIVLIRNFVEHAPIDASCLMAVSSILVRTFIVKTIVRLIIAVGKGDLIDFCEDQIARFARIIKRVAIG